MFPVKQGRAHSFCYCAMTTPFHHYAKTLGFDAVGICAPGLPAHIAEGLTEFISRGYHGDMQWMEERAQLRKSPVLLWPEAKSVIVVAHNYAPQTDPMQKLGDKCSGNISAYALNQDYHDIIKKKLKAYARWLVETHGGEVKVFVDTAPIMEKPLAQHAGIGWQGKHTCVVSREYGSWLFLGAIFTTLELPKDAPHAQHCGNCDKCMRACPTDAIIEPYKLDARKCIAYLTIEHKGLIPLEYRKAIGNRIYGCDDCLAVCPWNKFAEISQESAYHARDALQSPPLIELVKLDDARFRALFAKSPIKRIGRDRFVRNVLIAIGNSCSANFRETISPLAHDPSPLVAEATLWALRELDLEISQTAPYN